MSKDTTLEQLLEGFDAEFGENTLLHIKLVSLETAVRTNPNFNRDYAANVIAEAADVIGKIRGGNSQ